MRTRPSKLDESADVLTGRHDVGADDVAVGRIGLPPLLVERREPAARRLPPIGDADRMDELLAVREGIDSIERGEGVSLEELDREVRARYAVPDTSKRTGTE